MPRYSGNRPSLNFKCGSQFFTSSKNHVEIINKANDADPSKVHPHQPADKVRDLGIYGKAGKANFFPANTHHRLHRMFTKCPRCSKQRCRFNPEAQTGTPTHVPRACSHIATSNNRATTLFMLCCRSEFKVVNDFVADSRYGGGNSLSHRFASPCTNMYIGFHRLAIIDNSTGPCFRSQPYISFGALRLYNIDSYSPPLPFHLLINATIAAPTLPHQEVTYTTACHY